jgi:hypothetical protein
MGKAVRGEHRRHAGRRTAGGTELAVGPPGVAVLHGYILQSSDTSSPDPAPDGTREFENLASFERGELIATYRAREFASFDLRAGIFQSRGNYVLVDSKPVTFHGVTADVREVAPRMTQVWNARNP